MDGTALFRNTIVVLALPTVRVSVAEPVPTLLVAPRFTVKVPDAVGVQEIIPADVLIESPEGSPVAL